jgi:hypothetical protein
MFIYYLGLGQDLHYHYGILPPMMQMQLEVVVVHLSKVQHIGVYTEAFLRLAQNQVGELRVEAKLYVSFVFKISQNLSQVLTNYKVWIVCKITISLCSLKGPKA